MSLAEAKEQAHFSDEPLPRGRRIMTTFGVKRDPATNRFIAAEWWTAQIFYTSFYYADPADAA